MHLVEGSEVHCLAVRQHLAGEVAPLSLVGKCMLLIVMVVAVNEEAVVFWTAVDRCHNPCIWWSSMASKSLGCWAFMSGILGGV